MYCTVLLFVSLLSPFARCHTCHLQAHFLHSISYKTPLASEFDFGGWFGDGILTSILSPGQVKDLEDRLVCLDKSGVEFLVCFGVGFPRRVWGASRWMSSRQAREFQPKKRGMTH